MTDSMLSPRRCSMISQQSSGLMWIASMPATCTPYSHFCAVKSCSTLASRTSCRISLSSKAPFSGTMIFTATGCPPRMVLALTTQPKVPFPRTSSATYSLCSFAGRMCGVALSPALAVRNAARKAL